MFEYLIQKVMDAPFQDSPFKHLYIPSFFSNEHFREIVNSEEILIPPQPGDDELFDELYSKGYQIIRFPGCITDKQAYVDWHRHKSRQQGVSNSSCEGFGMVLRLIEPRTPILRELKSFLASDGFNVALAEKFGLEIGETTLDNGIQKYLDGYEISPHPDIRSKALTYMANINPHRDSESMEHHTKYLKFKDRFKYVEAFWQGNLDFNTCWVPWSWCDTVSEQKENNSMVVFSPSTDTMHGVKADYNHLDGQRTQLYGNIFYQNRFRNLPMPTWESLELHPRTHEPPVRKSLFSKMKSTLSEMMAGRESSKPGKSYRIFERGNI